MGNSSSPLVKVLMLLGTFLMVVVFIVLAVYTTQMQTASAVYDSTFTPVVILPAAKARLTARPSATAQVWKLRPTATPTQPLETIAQATQIPTRVPTLTFIPTVGADFSAPATCDCNIRWTCDSFRTHRQAQACFNACNDYSSKLDEDHDGIACEALP